MTKEQVIEQARDLLGKEEAQYLSRKLNGGESNEKGGKYESNFAVFKLSEAIDEILDCNGEQNIVFGSQVPGFVDDFVIHNTSSGNKKSYQLKNSPNVSWTSGKNSIARDFNLHFRMDQESGHLDTQTILTLSSEETYNKLRKSIPDEIKHHSECVLFKDFDNINKALIAEHEVRIALNKISISSEIGNLSHLHTVIMGVWENYKGTYCDVADFLQEVREIQPKFLRSSNDGFVLDSRVVEILDSIDGFSYEILDNRLRYVYSSDRGQMEGYIGLSNENALDAFSERLLNSNPSSFKDLFMLGILE